MGDLFRKEVLESQCGPWLGAINLALTRLSKRLLTRCARQPEIVKNWHSAIPYRGCAAVGFFHEDVVRMNVIDSRATDLTLGIVASIFSGIFVGILERLGVQSDIATTFVLIPVVVICFIIRKESLRITRITMLLAFLGVNVGVVYYLVFYVYRHVNVLVGGFGGPLYLVVHFLNVAILIPVFEEMVVRRFMFMGLAQYINALLAALIVSVLFGIAHRDIMIFAFVFSMCMCALAYRGIKTVDRAAIHGAFNGTLLLLLVALGN
jgi:membrane protease YdiL (CAAX protease family)